MSLRSAAFLLLAAFGASTAHAQTCKTLLTPQNAGNQGADGGQLFFDLDVKKSGGILVAAMEVDCRNTTPIGTPFTMEVWITPTTYVGNENNQAVWNLVSSGPGVVKGTPFPSYVDLTDFPLPQGQWGVALIMFGTGHRYLNGNGSNQVYSNPDLTLTAGAALSTPWTGTPFTPRVINGGIHYDCANVSSFCTSKAGLACGTPVATYSGIPSATAGSGFVISAGPARTCKSGILLYNVARLTPGVAFEGGTLCVETMGLRRAGPTSSQGTPGGANCDGQFTLDMNAFAVAGWSVPDCAGAPSGLPPNNPAGFLANVGQTVYTQFWGRDSVATGSYVSDGVQYVVGP